MFKALFGEVKVGRMLRLPYLGYSILLSVLMVGFVFAIAVAIGAGETILSGDLEAAQDMLLGNFAFPLVLLTMLAFGLFLFGGCNIMAKRFRDIGVPGWWMVLAVLIFTGLLAALVSEEVSNTAHTLIWILTLLLPSGLANSKADSQA